MGKYIYCIAESNVGNMDVGPLGIGDGGSMLDVVPYRDIAAVVSDSPIKKYPVCSENSFAHERAIEAVFKRCPVLPVRFCTIAEDGPKVLKILEREYARIRPMLETVRGKVELGLKALFHPRLVYEEILRKYPEIRRRKEALAPYPPQQVQRQLMEAGKMVEEALEAEKAEVRNEIIGALKGFCCEYSLSGRLLGERMIMNASFLVDRAQEGPFDKKVNELSARYGELVKFKYVGGFPPFSFISLAINVK